MRNIRNDLGWALVPIAIGFFCFIFCIVWSISGPIERSWASGISPAAIGTIQTSGAALAQQPTLNFIFSAGAGSCANNAGSTRTDCTVTGTTTGTVSTAVTLTNGQLVLGAGASAVKVGDLTGDVTTSGSTTTHMLHSIGFVIDGGGSVIATGAAKVFPTADFSCTINRVDISADQSGSITVDVWKVNAAIPVAANKISASAPLTLSAAQLAQSGSLTGWTTAVAVNDVFGFSVATVATVTRVTGQIWCQ